MNPGQRKHYFSMLWPAVLRANGWDKLNTAQREEKRRQVTRDAMTAVHGSDTDSTTDLGEAEITALFVYLGHLADPLSLVRAGDWAECQRDYIAFNICRQADFYQAKAYAGDPEKLLKERFQGRRSAAGETFQRPLTRAEAEQRRTTMRERARANGFRGRTQRGLSRGTPFKRNIKPVEKANCPF